jgi:hypothetical protein
MKYLMFDHFMKKEVYFGSQFYRPKVEGPHLVTGPQGSIAHPLREREQVCLLWCLALFL